MVSRPPLLVDIDDFMGKPLPLPDHTFRIGDGGEAHVGQFPNLRVMAFYVVGKAPVPLPGGEVDTLGMGPFALGALIGDAHLKLMRSPQLSPDQWELWADVGEIAAIIDTMLPLSPKADAVRAAFLYRVGEFMDLALHRPELLPEIIARLDALTNERLTERARAILETGIDPGTDDLWDSNEGGAHVRD